MYKLAFGHQKPKAKEFRKHCCNVMFPRVRQQLTNKMKEDLQQAIEKKDAALGLLNDDLQNCDNQTQAIHYENVALQAQRDVYQTQLQRCQDAITHLRTRYVDHARDPGKGNYCHCTKTHKACQR